VVTKEPLVVILPSDHRLAAHQAIDPHDLAGRDVYQRVEDGSRVTGRHRRYLNRLNLDIKPDHQVDNLAMAMSLVASTRGVALLPAYARNFLPWSVISRPIKGDAPTIRPGYRLTTKANARRP